MVPMVSGTIAATVPRLEPTNSRPSGHSAITSTRNGSERVTLTTTPSELLSQRIGARPPGAVT